jgi:acetoacetyl-CoA synthetase
VVDSLVVHLADGDTDELLLFVLPAQGYAVDDALRAKISAALRTALSPRHVPDEILAVAAVPRTLSGKKLEVPVKRILTGTPLARAAAEGALANPESLATYADLARRRAGAGL